MQTSFPVDPSKAPSRAPGMALVPRTPRSSGLALAIAAAAFDVAPEEIRARKRCTASVAAARHVAIYLAHIVFQLPMQAVADAFGRDRSTIGHAVRRVEDRRDEAGFDERMERLEKLAAFCASIEPAAGSEKRP